MAKAGLLAIGHSHSNSIDHVGFRLALMRSKATDATQT